MLVHSVFFWLKPDITKDDRDFFFQEVNALAGIESVKGFYCGRPASTPPREVVDTSYDCGLSVILSDMSGHDAYQDHPIHQRFIQNCSHLWEKVRIYDAD